MHDGRVTMRRELWRLLEEKEELERQLKEQKEMTRQALDLVRELRKELRK